jgi:hypothetical protein
MILFLVCETDEYILQESSVENKIQMTVKRRANNFYLKTLRRILLKKWLESGLLFLLAVWEVDQAVIYCHNL